MCRHAHANIYYVLFYSGVDMYVCIHMYVRKCACRVVCARLVCLCAGVCGVHVCAHTRTDTRARTHVRVVFERVLCVWGALLLSLASPRVLLWIWGLVLPLLG